MNSLPQSIVHCQEIMMGSADTVTVDLDLDMDLLAQQKELLLKMIWDIEDDQEEYKIWGIVYVLDSIQDQIDPP